MTDPQNPAAPEPPQQPASEPTAPQPPADAPPAPEYTAPAEPEAAPAAPEYTAPATPEYAAAPAGPAQHDYPAAPPAYPAASPAYPAAPPAAYGAPADAPVPGKTLGIVALVVVFFASVVGLILGYVARSQSKKAGVKNTPAKVAIILGWIFLVLSIIATIIIVIAIVNGAGAALQELCEGMEPGEYPLSTGGTITCP
ncbi:DUF4190 domain-containing protein [Microbacterium sp. QXD-8]|uniref:DUF4190 domain-containing protein n=1 Tax=Microbacterium psychrotolerans TaxID=3068321 RepID=A0ABU0Z654_9MICO|nr:DUF4190 domain-containing protein [Microbacterium sp. QXD-8]MDQ7880072.1 DUF4190 domain-containing protein [Microbacterium sp. QXD-8]